MSACERMSGRAFALFAGLLIAMAVAVAAVAAVAATPSTALAEPYQYTIRVWGGNQGTYDGANPAVYKVDAGSTFTLDEGKVTLTGGSQYYVKGFRVSGEDALAIESFTVSEDKDFVVAYGVPGDMVSYTVNFVEYGTGNALANDQGATSRTFYGKQGDKPIVPFEYIPGYRPRYLNITGTLGPEGTNSWTLEYIALTTEEVITVVVDEGGTTGGGATGGAAGGAAGGTTGGTEGTPGGTTPGGTTPGTETIIDIDNPLASGPSSSASGSGSSSSASSGTGSTGGQQGGGLPVVAVIGGIGAAVAAAAAGIVAWLKRRKK